MKWFRIGDTADGPLLALLASSPSLLYVNSASVCFDKTLQESYSDAVVRMIASGSFLGCILCTWVPVHL